MENIKRYFKNLTATQISQFEALDALYRDWNEKINVISRKDIDNLYEHHILHSLAIAKIIEFTPGSKILDVGTGGGFPGIPLAIMFPECQFLLVDRTGKKIKVAEDIANQIGLKNVTLRQCGVEEEKGLFDFVVSRAAMPMSDLFRISRKIFRGRRVCGSSNRNAKIYRKHTIKTRQLRLAIFFIKDKH
jgi:16S rRNA (guanine527-N7)-methyltransferase